ncbi:hypothetical protein CDAR_128401 [Caerostris darwini]|uniref:Ribosomal protein S10 n=1 Tax=Caerostris darwini TaxID=1538125 RepID=A0AAV4PF59_9ARAC|nr:hypothetical protein CDAR_128401 [Caerostris darwini]
MSVQSVFRSPLIHYPEKPPRQKLFSLHFISSSFAKRKLRLLFTSPFPLMDGRVSSENYRGGIPKEGNGCPLPWLRDCGRSSASSGTKKKEKEELTRFCGVSSLLQHSCHLFQLVRIESPLPCQMRRRHEFKSGQISLCTIARFTKLPEEKQIFTQNLSMRVSFPNTPTLSTLFKDILPPFPKTKIQAILLLEEGEREEEGKKTPVYS